MHTQFSDISHSILTVLNYALGGECDSAGHKHSAAWLT